MLYYFTYLLIILYVCFVGKRTLHMLQQNLYNENNRYIKWINKNIKTTIFNYSLILIPLSLIALLCNKLEPILLILMMIACIYC